jgi:hypothetical protein
MTNWRLSGFLCETTLSDQEQRTSIIGIMPGRLSFPSFPSALSLGAFVRVNPLPPPGTPIRVEILLNDTVILDLESASVEAPAEAVNLFGLDALHMNLARVLVQLTEPSVIKLRAGVAGEEPELLAAFWAELAKQPAQVDRQ